MWDDSRLRAARSYTSPDSPFSLRSSFTQSAHLFFGLPLLLPCTSIPITLFPTHSSLLITCPYHRILRSWTFFEISPTFVVPPIFSFLILSNLVTRHIHRNIANLQDYSCLSLYRIIEMRRNRQKTCMYWKDTCFTLFHTAVTRSYFDG